MLDNEDTSLLEEGKRTEGVASTEKSSGFLHIGSDTSLVRVLSRNFCLGGSSGEGIAQDT